MKLVKQLFLIQVTFFLLFPFVGKAALPVDFLAKEKQIGVHTSCFKKKNKSANESQLNNADGIYFSVTRLNEGCSAWLQNSYNSNSLLVTTSAIFCSLQNFNAHQNATGWLNRSDKLPVYLFHRCLLL